jgi:hypothetical protein
MSGDRHLDPGWTVVHSRDVALPVYRLTIDVVAQVEQVLPPLSEFALRALGAGLDTPDQIAAFLGLDLNDVQVAIVELVRDELVELAHHEPQSDGQLSGGIALTRKGQRLLGGGALTRAEEVRILVDYDGLLRLPVERRSWLLAPREVREEGLFEIPASPSRAPKLLELDGAEVMASIRATPRSAHLEILAISRILRAERRYVPALMLVYLKDRGKEIRPVFKVADLPQDGHSAAFVEAGGIQRLNLANASTDDKKGISARVEEALQMPVRRARRKANDQGMKAGARMLATYDHPRALSSAIESASERLIIVSPWLKSAVVNDRFARKVRRLLERGVDVYVGWGLGEQEASDKLAIARLTELDTEFENCHVEHFGDTHVKALVCDDRFAILGSFNWLSFRGDPNMPFRDERGFLVTNSAVVTETAADLLERFSATQ